MIYTIINTFHDTATTVRVNASGEMSYRQVRRCRKELCGNDNCLCSNAAGMRGPQEKRLTFSCLANGGGVLEENESNAIAHATGRGS